MAYISYVEAQLYTTAEEIVLHACVRDLVGISFDAFVCLWNAPSRIITVTHILQTQIVGDILSYLISKQLHLPTVESDVPHSAQGKI